MAFTTGQSFAFLLIPALNCSVSDNDRSLVRNDLHGHALVIESGLMVTIQRITIPHGMHWSSDVLLVGSATLIPWFYSTYDRSRMASTCQWFAFLLIPALKCCVSDFDRWLVENDLHGHVIVIEVGLMVTIQHITILHGMHWSSNVVLMGWPTLISWFYSAYRWSRMASTGQSLAFLLLPGLSVVFQTMTDRQWAMTCTVMLLWSNLVSWWLFNISRSRMACNGQVMFFWWDEQL